MPFSTAASNSMLDAVGITHVGALTDFPADSGAGTNEVTGGSYARQPITYDAAAAKSKAKNASPAVSIPIPAGTTVLFISGYSALTAGSIRKWAPVNGGSIKGVATVKNTGDVATSHAHGLVNNDRAFLMKANNEAIPGGLAENILYHIVGITADTFQVSLTSGGAAVAVTADGEFAWQKLIPEVFGSAGNLDVSQDTLDLLG